MGTTRYEARKAAARWIEVVYNRRRRHCALGMISPANFECRITQRAAQKETAA